jgi:hypothetical protein
MPKMAKMKKVIQALLEGLNLFRDISVEACKNFAQMESAL